MNIDPSNGRPCWTFNGDLDRPTLSPSLLVRTGHHITGQPPEENCRHCKDAKEDGHPTFCGICHSFIRDGKMEFLGDCTHKLSGQTVEIEDRP